MTASVVELRPKGANTTGGTRWKLFIALSGPCREGKWRRRTEVRGLKPAAATKGSLNDGTLRNFP